MFNFCIDFTYLSVNRVNGIGGNSNFSSQLWAELHCASPIPYHVFLRLTYISSGKHVRELDDVYPLEPNSYIAKLGYAGVYLFFLFLLSNIDCGYSLEPPRLILGFIT